MSEFLDRHGDQIYTFHEYVAGFNHEFAYLVSMLLLSVYFTVSALAEHFPSSSEER
jgi:hypothetical protein